MIIPMGGVIASMNTSRNMRRRQRERDETPKDCRDKGITCASCYKLGCDKRGKGWEE